MKTFLIQYTLPNNSNGYAIVNARDAKMAKELLYNRGFMRSLGYSIATMKEVDFINDHASVITEGVLQLTNSGSSPSPAGDELDPIFMASPAHEITELDVSNIRTALLQEALDGYATEEWVIDLGYLTLHLDLSEYAKLTDIITSYEDLDDKPAIPTKLSDLELDTSMNLSIIDGTLNITYDDGNSN